MRHPDMRLVKLSNWWCCWWYWSINCHGKIWVTFPKLLIPSQPIHNLQTSSEPLVVRFQRTSAAPHPFVSSVCSIASSVTSWVALPGAPSWHLTMPWRGCTKVECIKRENGINRKVYLFHFLFAIMNLCPISVHIYCLLLFKCCCLFSCVLFIVCGMQYRSWFCCSHCF